MTLSNHADYSAYTDEQLEAALSQVEIELKQTSNLKKQITEVIINRKIEELETLLKAKKEPYGTVHIGNFEVTFGKKVTYDQAILARLFDEIKAAGENPLDYIKREFDISESKFSAWPEPIKAQFIPARTVARGNPTIKIKAEKE